MTDIEDEIRRDHDTATAALRDLIDDRLTVAAFDLDPRDRKHLADVLLPLFTPSWEYGVRYRANDPAAGVHDADDPQHAAEMRERMGWGPTVRRLRASLRPGEWTESHQ